MGILSTSCRPSSLECFSVFLKLSDFVVIAQFRSSSAKSFYNLKCPSLKYCKHDQILSHSCPTSKSAFSVISANSVAFFTPICNHDRTGRCWLLFKVASLGFGTKQSNSSSSKRSERPHAFASCRCVSIQNCGAKKVASSPLPFSDNSTLFFLWPCVYN